MDLVDDFEQDSGMESSPLYGDDSSKDDTPERKPEDLTKDVHVAGMGDPLTDKTPTAKDQVVADKKPVDTVARLGTQESYDDEPDETLAERLWGLSEMFPESLVYMTSTVASKSWSGIKALYSFSRTASWLVASTSVILFAPVLFELERAKMDEMQKSQQKQFLLGPSAAMMGSGAPPPPIPR